MEMTDRPLVRDYSRWQDKLETPEKINVKVAQDNGVVAVVCRSSKSRSEKDPVFIDVYSQARELGMPRASYHLYSPGANLVDQFTIWFEQHPVDGCPRAIDLEVNWNNLEPYEIAKELWQFVMMVYQETGDYPWIYTRANLFEKWIAPFWTWEQINVIKWWLAQYDRGDGNEYEGIYIPHQIDVDNVIMKQTSDKIEGFPGEVESAFVDRNRWLLGDAEDLYDFWPGGQVDPGEPGEPGVHVHPELAILSHKINVLNNRVDAELVEVYAELNDLGDKYDALFEAFDIHGKRQVKRMLEIAGHLTELKNKAHAHRSWRERFFRRS